MAAPLQSRLRAPAIVLAALLAAGLAVAATLLAQRTAADQAKAAEMVAAFGLEIHHRERVAHSHELLERAIDLDGDADLQPLRALLDDYAAALAARRGEREAFRRLERDVHELWVRQNAEADRAAATANAESAVLLGVALLLAGLLLWRFRATRRKLERLTRQAEVEAAGQAAAWASEQRFRRFAEHAADGFFLVDRDARVVDVNRAACESLGYTREQLLELTMHDVVVGSTRVSFEERWESPGGEPLTIEGRHRRKDGSTFPVETRMGFLDADGERLLLALARDRSGRLDAERALRFQAQLLDQVDAAVVATDLHGRVTHWSRGAAELLGLRSEEALGRGVDELGLLGPRARATLPDVLGRLRRGAGWDQELRLTRPDGTRFHAYVSAGPIRDEAGEPLGLVGVAVDVSERKQTANELARRAEQQAAVAELGRLAITGTAVEELMNRAVAALERMFDAEHPTVLELLPGGREVVLRAAAPRDAAFVGSGRAPVTPDGMLGYVLARSEPVVAPNLERETRFEPPPLLRERGVRSTLSTVIEGKDGPFGLLSVHAEAVRTYSKDDVNFVRAVANVLSAAITRRREEQLEQQLQRARRLESVGQLAGGVAHDFNNLLAVILNFAHFALAEAEEGSTMHEDLDEIRRAAERAAELTRQLLVFSRREPVATSVVDVNEAVAGIEEMLRRTIGEHIELCSERGDGLPPIRIGSGQLEQVLVNLALNARDAMPDGGRLTIRTANADDAPGVRLAVEDTGSGMAPEVASQAFDPFFTTKPKGEGTGLGLASVYGIVSQAGGEASIDSWPGEGTRVSIWLPASADAPAGQRERESPLLEGCGESILVVEDEDQVRALTSRILSEHGYAVTEAHCGEAALEAWEASGRSIEVLVTDVVMPGMSGAQLAERLLADKPDMKVLYMSGYTGDALLRHGPRDRDVAVLEKPFGAELLLRRVRETCVGPIESRAWI